MTIFGIQNDRIVRVGSTWSTSALQTAMKRAIERHNVTRFTPVGHVRDLAVTTLRLVIEALADGNTALAAAVLEQLQPDSPDNTTTTVTGCIGVALGLLDDWFTGSDPHAPSGLGQRVKLPAGPWRTAEQVELAPLHCVDWFSHQRLYEACGDIPPAELETAYNRQDAALVEISQTTT